ncbi:MAG: FmdB family zinc ribbon protein [Nocardioidaceae bacterium]
MPVYQYACTECGEELEVRQSFTDDSLTVCPGCAGRLRKVLSAVGVVFKGSGFYHTDSRTAPSEGDGSTKGSSENGAQESQGSKESGSKDSSGDSGDSKPAPAKDSSSNGSTGGSGSGSSGSSGKGGSGTTAPAAAGN